jgi:sialate O-acetylesterase
MFGASISMHAKVVLPPIFSDGMVLQRNTNANIWGTAKKSSTVTIRPSWTKKIYVMHADMTGKWKTSINTPDAGGPYTIDFNDGERLTLKGVLIGEVWVCSGQSNMEMPMQGFRNQPVENANVEILHSADASLRLFTVKRNPQFTPVDTLNGQWSEASPASVANFSATAYYFGRELRQVLHVPVGLVVTSFGGSFCEAWMSADWMKAFPELSLPTREAMKKNPHLLPTTLYNGMLHPIIGMTMRGVIWYQGEANTVKYQNYSRLFSTLIKGWRSEWGEGNFPFYFCQIAPYSYDRQPKDFNSSYLREQQSKVEFMVPNCGMAVLSDAGLEFSVHPRKKMIAGQRLALLAFENTYGIKGVKSRSAYFKDAQFKNDTVVVSFSRSTMGITGKNGMKSDLFEVAGADRKFYPARAWIAQDKVFVKSEEVNEPVAVRYAFHNYIEGDLYSDGLPLSSFRSDNW